MAFGPCVARHRRRSRGVTKLRCGWTDDSRFCVSPCSIYFLITIATFLLTCWKLGAYTNYIFEVCLAACLVLTESVRETCAQGRWSKSTFLIGFCLCLAGLADLTIARKQDYSFY